MSPVFSNNESDYLEKLPFQPLPPKVVVKKKKRGRSKNKEETVSSPKHISPIMVVPNEHESKIIEDDPLDCIHYYLDVKSIGTIEEDKYCNQHKHERTSKWLKDLYKFASELNDQIGRAHV